MTDQEKPSGRWQKGLPSPNPGGRPVTKAKGQGQAPGSDGVIAYGGYIASGEQSNELRGREKWKAYANLPHRSAPVAVAYLLRSALLASVKWTAVENPAGGKAARRGLEVVEEGLLNAPLPIPFPLVMTKALNGRHFGGFSIHAAGIARRSDGLVTYTDIGHRSPHTVDKWLRSDPTKPFDKIEQRIDSGETYTIPLNECLYLKNDMMGDGPEGVGVLRFIVERQRQTWNYRSLEGSELFSGMGGTPIARVPLSRIGDGLTGTEEQIKAKKRERTANIESIVSDRVKTPEKRQYVVLDSRTYQGTNPNTISQVKEWDIEIVKAELGGLTEIRKVITDNDLDDARVLGVEFVWVGGGDTRGTFAMVESKVSLLSAQLSGDLDIGGTQATNQLGRRIVAANGLDPDEATPTIMASPISTEDVEKAARTLGLLDQAGLARNHPAKKVFFDRMGLPYQEESEADLALPRGTPPKNPNDPKVDDRPKDDDEEINPTKEPTA